MIRSLLTLITCMAFTQLSYAQLANDACTGAINFGVLPTPADCGPNGTGGGGQSFTYNGTNLGARPENNAPPGIIGCNGGPQSIPAADVWYKFVASGNTMNVKILSQGISKPTIALWTGQCGNLTPLFCHSQGTPNINQTINSLAPGTTYFLQVHGDGTQDQGTFSIELVNSNSCDICVLNTSLTVTPPPENGTYKADQKVDFCFKIDEFRIVSNNWIHGVSPKFGPAWDLSTLATSPAKSCKGDGEWGWYNSVRSSVTNKVFGPGFFYESTGAPNNPGDNFGDDCEGTNVNWEFCWSIKTKQKIACEHGSDLGIAIETYSDGESGAWESPACSADPVYIFVASQDCCEKPQVVSAPSCQGAASGKITVTGDGKAPWIYTLRRFDGTLVNTSPPEAGPFTFEGLEPGTYFAYAEDSKGCDKYQVVNIGTTTPPTVTVNVEDPSCAGECDGKGTIVVNGGTQPYFAEWSNGETGLNATELCGNTPYVVFFSDNAGCEVRKTVLLGEPSKLLVIQNEFVDVKCSGTCDGKVDITGSGGTPPYTFLWSDGSTEKVRNDLCENKRYNVTITDSKGCEADTFFQTGQPPKFVVSANITDEECRSNDGDIDVSVSGATPPYTFKWFDGTVTEDRTNVPAGVYKLSITDSENCLFVDSFEVERFSNVTFNTEIDKVSCFQGKDGKITANSTNATPPFAISIDGVNFSNPIENLSAGTYTVTLKDAKQCEATNTVIITQPDSVETNPIIDSASCFNGTADGSIKVVPQGGNGGFTYEWDNGSTSSTYSNLARGTYTLILRDASGCEYQFQYTVPSPPNITFGNLEIIPEACLGDANGAVQGQFNGGSPPYEQVDWSDGVQSFPRSNMAPANYSLTVTDAKGCKNDTSIRILSPPSELTLNYTVNSNIKCFGDSSASVNISASGGVAPYAYLWPGGNTSSSRQNIPGGTYNVSVTDSYNCQKVIEVVIDQPDELSTNPSIEEAICLSNIGSINPNISGGTNPYKYQWDYNNSTASTLSNLEEGTYQLTVTDANNCTAEFTYQVENNGFIRVVPYVDSVSCQGYTDGSITIQVENGTEPYSINWSNGNTQSILVNLAAGTYTVTVVDANGCIHDTTAIVYEPEEPTFLKLETVPTCFGDSDGQLEILPLENVQTPFTINWFGYGEQNPLTNIPAGTYSGVIQDNKGCLFNRSFELSDAIEVKVNAGPDKKVFETSSSGFSIRILPRNAEYYIKVTPTTGLFETNDTTFQVVIDEPIEYIIEVQNEKGCLVFDTIKFDIIDQSRLVVPNVFTPNGDGQNDVFVTFQDFFPKNFLATIYNRWGNVVYRTQDPSINWNGKISTGDLAPSGLYICVIEFQDPLTGESIRKFRQITLVR